LGSRIITIYYEKKLILESFCTIQLINSHSNGLHFYLPLSKQF
jgi:hypothetical protein